MGLPQANEQRLLDFLVGLLKVPSPTGYTQNAANYVMQNLTHLPGLDCAQVPKGGVMITFRGEIEEAPRGLTAHLDTLGAMVKVIKPNGRLQLSGLGGYCWNSVEGESCSVFTRQHKTLRGSLMITTPSVHVYGKKVEECKRDAENMEVRLDERTSSAAETRELGVEVGDFVSFDPRVEMVNGFIRSRHLDDKAGVACLVEAIHSLSETSLKPRHTAYFYLNNFEEEGHFAAADFPSPVSELLAVDMAAVGEGQTSDEFHTTLCVKDSSGPYHQGMCEKMRRLAEQKQIDYRVDIYPHYGSDASAFWNSGGNVPTALIGPGVEASHHYERTHLEALLSTTQWIMAYLLGE